VQEEKKRRGKKRNVGSGEGKERKPVAELLRGERPNPNKRDNGETYNPLDNHRLKGRRSGKKAACVRSEGFSMQKIRISSRFMRGGIAGREEGTKTRDHHS